MLKTFILYSLSTINNSRRESFRAGVNSECGMRVLLTNSELLPNVAQHFYRTRYNCTMAEGKPRNIDVCKFECTYLNTNMYACASRYLQLLFYITQTHALFRCLKNTVHAWYSGKHMYVFKFLTLRINWKW